MLAVYNHTSCEMFAISINKQTASVFYFWQPPQKPLPFMYPAALRASQKDCEFFSRNWSQTDLISVRTKLFISSESGFDSHLQVIDSRHAGHWKIWSQLNTISYEPQPLLNGDKLEKLKALEETQALEPEEDSVLQKFQKLVDTDWNFDFQHGTQYSFS